MGSKNSFKGASFLLAAGAVIGAWATSKWFERRNVNGDVIVQNVRKLWNLYSWIVQNFMGKFIMAELLVRKMMNLSNTNFMQMQKQEPLLIYTKLDNQRKLEDLQLLAHL